MDHLAPLSSIAIETIIKYEERLRQENPDGTRKVQGHRAGSN